MYKMLCLASRVNPEQEFLEKKAVTTSDNFIKTD